MVFPPKIFIFALSVGASTLLLMGCDIALRRVASTTTGGCTGKIATRAIDSIPERQCPESLQCFYEVYSPTPVDLEEFHVAGVAFRPQLYLIEKGLPVGVSRESFREDARCFDPATKKWIHGTPDEVLKKLHCLGS